MPNKQSTNIINRQDEGNNSSLSHLKFNPKQQAITVPPNDDDLFTLIQRLQSRRLDEQRSEIPKTFNSTSSSKILNNKN